MRVLITGANGFIGRNLRLRLSERKDIQIVCYARDHETSQLTELLENVDFVFHLAGVNRPQDPKEFTTVNTDFTHDLYTAVAKAARLNKKQISIVFTSSTQAALDNAYGRSKREAEGIFKNTELDPLVPVHVFRLPNVFGKWCRPNYNSVVATFCHNVARNLPIQINDHHAKLALVYIDDLIDCFVQLLDGAMPSKDTDGFATVKPIYSTTVGGLAEVIQSFRDSRRSLLTERVGTGLVRALYATYVSYLPVELFAYDVPQHADQRGVFVEMLKTPDCGQFSYFTAHPGVTRGGHYHHSKTEKFLVISGQALFRFRHMESGQVHELQTSGEKPQIVETVPGWTHDVRNIGSGEMVVMLWANEVFDRTRPDTYDCPV